MSFTEQSSSVHQSIQLAPYEKRVSCLRGSGRYDPFFFLPNSAYSAMAGNGKGVSIQTDNGEMQDRSSPEQIQEMGNNSFRMVVDVSA